MNFNDRLKKISENNKLVKHKDGQVWPIEKRLEVVHQFLILGNLKLVAAVTGVDYQLVRKWKTQAWWPELIAEVRATQNIEMDTKLSDIVEKTLHAVHDRVVNGDYFYNQKTGAIERRPAPLRDIHRVAVDLLSKREMLRDKDKGTVESSMSIDEHLKMLASNMAQWFEKESKRPPTITLEEVEDAVYEERETGLQDGEREVQLASGTGSEEGGEESGPSGSGEEGGGIER